MDPMATAGVAATDPSGLVAADAPCRRCSYNVKGLSLAGRCPECGTPVGVSIHGDLLRYSDPEWVDKVARGMNLILWGILITIVAAFVGIALSIVADPWVGEFVGFLGGLVGLVGAWLLTELDPGTQEPPQTVTARRIVRIALLVGLAQNILSLGLDANMQPMLRRLLGFTIILLAIVAVIGQFAQLYYLEILAKRIPDERLAKRANTVRWGFGITYGLMIIFGAIAGFLAAIGQGPGGTGAGFFMFFGCIVVVAAIGALVYAIIYLIMLFQFNRALKLQADWARQTWAAVVNTPQGIVPPPASGAGA